MTVEFLVRYMQLYSCFWATRYLKRYVVILLLEQRDSGFESHRKHGYIRVFLLYLLLDIWGLYDGRALISVVVTEVQKFVRKYLQKDQD